MMKTPERRRWVPLLAAAALLAGCGDSGTEPLPDYDPFDTVDRIDAVLEPLDMGRDVYAGLELATDILYYYGADAVADLLRASGTGLIQEAVPDAAALREEAARHLARRAGADGAVLPRLAFPSAIQGRTLVWDPGQSGYVIDTSLTGAPANGVRIVYYVSDASGTPTSSATPLGYIDLTDEDRSLAERVGVRIVEYGATVSQDREVADYAVEMSVSGGAAAGTLEFGMAGMTAGTGDVLDFDLVQRFSWSDSQNYDRLVMDYRFDTDRGPLTLALDAQSGFEAPVWERIEYTVRFGAGGATTAQLNVFVDQNDRLSGGIVVDGRTVIEISGTDGNPQFRRPRGDALTSSEIATLEQVWVGVWDMVTLVEWLMVPADLLLLAG